MSKVSNKAPTESEQSDAGQLGAGAEVGLATEPTVVGYIVRCHRDRGIWRAGRFWPPENLPVPAEDLTEDQLVALQNEPLLSVQPVQE